MLQFRSIIAVLVIAVYLENTFILGNPIVLKKLKVGRQMNEKDGSALCMKMCPVSSELDWLFDWFDDDNDEDCTYKCDITLNKIFTAHSKESTPETKHSADNKTEGNSSDKKGDNNTVEKKDNKEENKTKKKEESKTDKKKEKDDIKKDDSKVFHVSEHALPP